MMLATLTHLALVPLVGATLLLLCSRMLGGPVLTFRQWWKLYLAAAAYGLILVLLLSGLLSSRQLDAADLLALHAGMTCLIHFLVVTLWLRKFSFRPLLAQGLAVGLTNLATVAVLIASGRG
jgi:hypothetical protein